MHTIYTNSAMSDDERRRRLYEGQLFVLAASEGSRRLIGLARQMIEEAFNGNDPLTAQYAMPVEEYVAIVTPLKPKFIHHQETKRLLGALLVEMGCSPEETYQDVPRLRMVTSDSYLTSGVGYVHHPHRDTWYSAPFTQINWWLPIYPFESESSMAFHPRYWSKPLRNGSGNFNYYEWNTVGRATASQHIKTDTRKQPKPLEPVELDPQIRIVPEPGGMILFSAAQLHSSVPNTSGRTRYSIDFRTTHIGDLRKRISAPNIDSACTGTSLRDFVRVHDLAAMPEDVVAMYDSGPAVPEEALVYRPA